MKAESLLAFADPREAHLDDPHVRPWTWCAAYAQAGMTLRMLTQPMAGSTRVF
jgi:hypothetical protein